MIFTELTEEEFDKFVNYNYTHNFFQTSMMKKHLEEEKRETYLVGIKKNKKVIAAALICSNKYRFIGKKIFECYKGFILDYQDTELLTFMTQETCKFLKGKGGFRLVIDPYIPRVSRDMDANIVPGINNKHIIDQLKKLGYKENKGDQVKWCYCLDIEGKSSQQLFEEFRSTTRNIVNKTINKYLLNIRTLKKEELPDFKKITMETCDRRSFKDKSLSYYESMFDCFKENVVYKICELDCEKYINSLKQINEELKQKISKLSDAPANKGKRENLQNDILNNERYIGQVNKLIEEKGKIVPLSCAMFMLYGDEIVYLFSGSYADLMQYCGQYALQWDIIKYAADNKYRKYNFYGIKDVFNEKGKDRGVYEFKKGFGGYVEELLGSYEISLSIINKLYRLKQKIKK